MRREGRHFTSRPDELRGHAKLPEVRIIPPQNTKPIEKYPEHQKLKTVQEKSQDIGEFIEWLRNVKDIRFAKWVKETVKNQDIFGKKPPTETLIDVFVQQTINIEQILAEFFKIDLNKIEQEKRAMLDEIRKLNDQSQK